MTLNYYMWENSIIYTNLISIMILRRPINRQYTQKQYATYIA